MHVFDFAIVLIELAAQTSIDKWFNNENWLSARHVCSWFGVHCNPHNYVTKLSLEDNGLKQSLNSGFDVIELLSSLSNLKVREIPGYRRGCERFALETSHLSCLFGRISFSTITT